MASVIRREASAVKGKIVGALTCNRNVNRRIN